MDNLLALVLTVAATLFVAAYASALWLYDFDVPHPAIVVDDLKALRTMLLILRTGSDALTQMFAESTRDAGRE